MRYPPLATSATSATSALNPLILLVDERSPCPRTNDFFFFDTNTLSNFDTTSKSKQHTQLSPIIAGAGARPFRVAGPPSPFPSSQATLYTIVLCRRPPSPFSVLSGVSLKDVSFFRFVNLLNKEQILKSAVSTNEINRGLSLVTVSIRRH